jgi:hypothetical protein
MEDHIPRVIFSNCTLLITCHPQVQARLRAVLGLSLFCGTWLWGVLSSVEGESVGLLEGVSGRAECMRDSEIVADALGRAVQVMKGMRGGNSSWEYRKACLGMNKDGLG